MVKFMKRNIFERIYIWYLVKMSRIANIKIYKHYTVVFKYDNVVDYFQHVVAFNKYDAKKIIRTLLLLSDQFNIKDKNSIQIIVIKEDEDNEI